MTATGIRSGPPPGTARSPGEPADSAWRTISASRTTRPQLRAGVVGIGKQAVEDHIPGLIASDCASLVAICDDNPSIVRAQQEQHGVPGYTDFREMFKAEELDLVVVTVPHHVGRSVIETAAEHHVHVLKEKPFATTIAEARALAGLCDQAGIQLMVTLQRRFNPIYTSFLQLADQVGTPFMVDAQYTIHTPDPSEGWRGHTVTAGGGCIIDMGYHIIDMIQWYFGQPGRILADISVSARPDRDYDAEDTALIHFAYDSGLYGSLLISRFIGPKNEHIRLVGTKGMVHLERGRVQRLTNHGDVIESLSREVRAGDEVIVPAYGFYATVTPLLHLGAVPVLADCDANGNLDTADAARKITARTAAIAVTHMWGVPAGMPALRALADTRDLTLLEDCSHAHGARIGDRKVGTFGLGAAFSMNGPKPLSAGEGGFVLTDDDETYYRVLLHGQYNKRCRSEIPADHPLHRYAVTGMGLKHRIHPLAAAIAAGQLRHLDEYLEGREKVAAYITGWLRGVPGIGVPELDGALHPSWYGMILQYRPEELGGLPAARFHEALLAEGCLEADLPGSTCPLNLLPLFQDPGALFPAYQDAPAYRPGDFPRAEAFHAGAIKLPVWHRDEDLQLAEQYVRAFREVSAGHRDLLG